MKKVSVFQTSDGKLHENELDAIYAEFKIELRSVIQSDECACIRDERVPIANLLTVIAANGVKIRDVINKYNQKIKGLSSRKPLAPTS